MMKECETESLVCRIWMLARIGKESQIKSNDLGSVVELQDVQTGLNPTANTVLLKFWDVLNTWIVTVSITNKA